MTKDKSKKVRTDSRNSTHKKRNQRKFGIERKRRINWDEVQFEKVVPDVMCIHALLGDLKNWVV